MKFQLPHWPLWCATFVAIVFGLAVGLTLLPHYASGAITCTSPTTGASVNVSDGWVDVTEFGANGADKTNDDTAFSAAFACLANVLDTGRPGRLYIPAGMYVLRTPHQLIETLGSNWGDVTIVGAGQYSSVILSPESHDELINIHLKSQSARLSINGLSFVAEPLDAGTALNINMPAESEYYSNLHLHRLKMHGIEAWKNPGHFTHNISVTGGKNVDINNAKLRGVFFRPDNADVASESSCLRFRETRGLTITNSECSLNDLGVDYSGAGPVQLINNHSFGVKTNIAVKANLTRGTVAITNTHFNSYDTNVWVSGADELRLKNVLTLSSDESSSRDHQTIYVEETDTLTVLDSKFNVSKSIEPNPNRYTVTVGKGVGTATFQGNVFDEPNYLLRGTLQSDRRITLDDTNVITDRQKQ